VFVAFAFTSNSLLIRISSSSLSLSLTLFVTTQFFSQVHLVIGMAGYQLTNLVPFESLPSWIVHAQQDNYGFVTLDFNDQIHVRFVNNDHKILDTFEIDNKYRASNL
jgi:hypothetical protein